MSQERNVIEDAKQLGQVIADVRNLTKSVDKLDHTVSDFGDRLDQLALDMNTLLGTQNSLLELQRQVNTFATKLESVDMWKIQNESFIEKWKSEEQDNTRRFKDLAWKWLPTLLMFLLSLYLLISKSFVNQKVLENISTALENGFTIIE